jgi:hypothetical protein
MGERIADNVALLLLKRDGLSTVSQLSVHQIAMLETQND